MAFLVGGANSAVDTEPYDIDNSCRFNNTDNIWLTFTPGSAGNRKTWTFSFWLKRASIGDSANQSLFSANANASAYMDIPRVSHGDGEKIRCTMDGSTEFVTSAMYRDPAAWMHIVYAVDTNQGTDTNRTKLYVNGEQISSFSTGTYPAEDAEHDINNTVIHTIGAYASASSSGNGDELNAYLADYYFIDGTQYAASAFGETDEDSGIWKPKKFSGTFGSNGWFLEFKATGTNADSSGIGADTSGNGNHFTVANFTAEDQTTDTPTNNFATANSLTGSSTLSEGNCKVACADNDGVGGTFGVSNGKWYVEAKATTDSYTSVGISKTTEQFGRNLHSSTNTYMYSYVGSAYKKSVLDTTPDAYTNGDIITLMIDCDNNKLFFKKNDSFITTSEGTHDGSSTGISIDDGEFYTTANTANGNTGDSEWNFGNPPFAISSGNADANGYGNFEYAVPSGYYALCTKNLAEYG
jgi:hypothetical protein